MDPLVLTVSRGPPFASHLDSIAGLDTHLMDARSLDLIVEPAGRLINLDQAIELLSKGRFARVAMEVDLSAASSQC